MKLETKKDGMMYYVIKKGTKIYRGDNRMYTGEYTWEEIKSKPIFFALTKDVAEKEYGVTYEFTTDKEYDLLALDHKKTVSKLLLTISDNKIKRIIELNYGYKSTRNSHLENDSLLMNYLCQQGYKGYATKEMDTDFGGKFHPELMICDPKHIKSPIQVTVDEKKIHKIIEDYREKINVRNVKKKQRSVFIYDANDAANDTNDFDNYDTNYDAYNDNYDYNDNTDLEKSNIKSFLFHSPIKQSLFHSPVKQSLFHSPVKQSLFHSPVRTQKILFHNTSYQSPSKTPIKKNRKTKSKSPSLKIGGKQNKSKKANRKQKN